VAAAAVVIAGLPAHSQHHAARAGAAGAQLPAQTGGRPASTRGVLLAAAVVAGNAPAAAGGYWYIRERDFEPAASQMPAKTGSAPAVKTARKAWPGAIFAETQETWAGPARSRTTVDENLRFSWASAADKAKWQAAGQPPLAGANGSASTLPVTSNYDMSLHWGVGNSQLGWAGVRKLPATAPALGRTLRRMWNATPDKSAAVGLPHPSFGQYVVQWAAQLLPGPARPGTKAALYQLLAGQPDVTIVPAVTDPLGRAGVAVSDGGGDYLVIDPRTAQPLAYTSQPVHAHAQLSGTGGVEVYEATGWASRIGGPARP
jgi:hypothetical protein